MLSEDAATFKNYMMAQIILNLLDCKWSNVIACEGQWVGDGEKGRGEVATQTLAIHSAHTA